MHYRRSEVLINLSRSFPQLKYGKIVSIADDFYTHLGQIFAEAIWFSGCYHNPERLRKQRIMEIENQALMNQVYEDSSSVTVLTSHCGNWELFGGVCYYNFVEDVPVIPKEKLRVVYKELTNKVSDEVFKKARPCPMEGFDGMLESNQILRHALVHKDEKLAYYIVADQHPYQTPVLLDEPFLNQKTYGMLGTFKLAVKLHHAVMFAHILRKGRGHYVIRYEKMCDDASQFTPEQLMNQYFKILEQDIIADPANWLWSHRRWKKF